MVRTHIQGSPYSQQESPCLKCLLYRPPSSIGRPARVARTPSNDCHGLRRPLGTLLPVQGPAGTWTLWDPPPPPPVLSPPVPIIERARDDIPSPPSHLDVIWRPSSYTLALLLEEQEPTAIAPPSRASYVSAAYR
ncbi:hypothetical protein LX36DRAFT_434327 [Colletotrichum falcatum]|nr:hypothetical protein LX36DRAFT_434327 [Colletotrichum falcatum]